jgi:hypothetical protein
MESHCDFGVLALPGAGFGEACAAAADVTAGDLLLVEPDVRFEPGELDVLTALLVERWPEGIAWRDLSVARGRHGCARLYRRQALRHVGLFDRRLPALEGVDWCARAGWAGWRGTLSGVPGEHLGNCWRHRRPATYATLAEEAIEILLGKWGSSFWQQSLKLVPGLYDHEEME